MKIAITCDNFDPNKGYFEYYLSHELSKKNCDITIFAFSDNKNIVLKNIDDKMLSINIPYLFALKGIHIPTIIGMRFMIDYIKKNKITVILCKPSWTPLAIFVTCYKETLNLKIFGSLITGELDNSLLIKIFLKAIKVIIKIHIENRTQKFIELTPELKEQCIKLFNVNPNKFVVIPLGVDPKLFRFNIEKRTVIRNRLSISDEDILLIYSGKITKSKKIHILLSSLSHMVENNYKLKLLIIGKGNALYLDYLKTLIMSLQLCDNVIFHPWVHRTKLPELYSAGDIAVWPGSTSISIIEAAAVSLPLIVRRSIFTNYAISNDNGLNFEDENVSELTNALEKLCSNRLLRKKMGERSRKLIEKQLNWKLIAEKYYKLFNITLKH